MRLTPQRFSATIRKRISCRYLLHLPHGYSSAARKRWPVLLFLHGAGERGDELELVKKHGPFAFVEAHPESPFILVAPQCPAEEWWDTDVLSALLDHITKRYRVDRRRTYVTGLSMGGYGTWALALAEPKRFAAIAPICGGGNRLLAARIAHLPVWAFHGAKDDVVPLEQTERMIQALRFAGAEPKFTVYPDAAHDSWTVTYNMPELYAWLLEHKR